MSSNYESKKKTCADVKSKLGIKVKNISAEFLNDLNSRNQDVKADVVTSNSNLVLAGLITFFNMLSSEMKSLKEKKEKEKSIEITKTDVIEGAANILGRVTNTSLSLMSKRIDDINTNLSKKIEDLGIRFGSQREDVKSDTIDLNKESEDVDINSYYPKPMTLRSQLGFTTKPGLFVFMGLMLTITEMILIYIFIM